MTNSEAVAVDTLITPWSLSADFCLVTPEGKDTGVVLKKEGGRYIAQSFERGTPIWSGPDLKHFIQHFWGYSFEKDTK